MGIATYYAGYTLGPTVISNTLSFDGTLLGSNTNDVAQASQPGYGGSIVSSNVATILSGTNTVQYSLTMPGYYVLLSSREHRPVGSHAPAVGLGEGRQRELEHGEQLDGRSAQRRRRRGRDQCPDQLPLTITLDEPVTLGTLILGNSDSTTVGYTLIGSGSNTLTFSNSGYGATITVANGSHVIDAPVVLADNLVVSGSGKLAFGTSSSITDEALALTMNGAGEH